VILADTHAWIWWIAGSRRLSRRAFAALESADAVGLCAISLWEVAMLVARGRLEFDREVSLWLRQSLAMPRAALVPIDPEIATVAVGLDWAHADPADRLIAATAIVHGAPLVSKDARLRGLSSVRTIW
jgi:PIN domain nuclease of toxin-antitoxin system